MLTTTSPSGNIVVQRLSESNAKVNIFDVVSLGPDTIRIELKVRAGEGAAAAEKTFTQTISTRNIPE